MSWVPTSPSIPTERHGGIRHLLNTLWIKVPGEGPHFLVTVSSYRTLMRATLSKENRQLAWHQAIWIWVSTVYRSCVEKSALQQLRMSGSWETVTFWTGGRSHQSLQESDFGSSAFVLEKNMAQSHLAYCPAKPERNQEIILNNTAWCPNFLWIFISEALQMLTCFCFESLLGSWNSRFSKNLLLYQDKPQNFL